MKVIILKTNEVKEVTDGHARNYLFPHKLAVPATEKALAALDQKKQEQEKLSTDQKEKDQKKAAKIGGQMIEIKVKAGEDGKLFGSVTAKEIAKKLGLKKTQIQLDSPIKEVAEYDVDVKIGTAMAQVKVIIVAESRSKRK